VTGSTHSTLGMAVGAAVAANTVGLRQESVVASMFGGHLSPIWAFAALVVGLMLLGSTAALLPDADLPQAPAGRVVWLWLLPGVRHRGPTHSIAAMVMATAVFGVVAWSLVPGLWPQVVLVVGFAYLSHLVADAPNPTPMAWLWPFVRRPLRPRWLPEVSERSWRGRVLEALITSKLVALGVLWAYQHLSFLIGLGHV
jgi:membrane-bound metal-dependent hydrolase YbcI (DUF457 family)